MFKQSLRNDPSLLVTLSNLSNSTKETEVLLEILNKPVDCSSCQTKKRRSSLTIPATDSRKGTIMIDGSSPDSALNNAINNKLVTKINELRGKGVPTARSTARLNTVPSPPRKSLGDISDTSSANRSNALPRVDQDNTKRSSLENLSAESTSKVQPGAVDKKESTTSNLKEQEGSLVLDKACNGNKLGHISNESLENFVCTTETLNRSSQGATERDRSYERPTSNSKLNEYKTSLKVVDAGSLSLTSLDAQRDLLRKKRGGSVNQNIEQSNSSSTTALLASTNDNRSTDSPTNSANVDY